MIPFKFSPMVRFTVDGTYNDDSGVSNPFSFWLKCERRETDHIDELLKRPGATLADVIQEVTRDWGDVKTDSGEEVPFTQDNLRTFLMQPGVAIVCFNRYAQESGAKAKN